ncbi:hypothetical protein SAY87_011672 [Trapa incisa]|uniref:Uncharacterized protein n=1 Tax=Trapa incisa TaxID=236973 RepID=A0AAN7JJ83_9MYRT|nr:hypothetical protein SAY87_011672 [Trapa incisa]
MEANAKGTVTSLTSMFSVEEVRKATERVEAAIAEKRKEIEHFREFISENSNLISLVKKLPEELNHDIMASPRFAANAYSANHMGKVPFGKAAFFPGRLIHTNEFMVLLGEGYFVERTSKQTVEILKRRGEYLESKVNSSKAIIEDLKAEASFFGSTASELEEDLVEIREELSDEGSHESIPESGLHEQDSNPSKGYEEAVSNEEEEYARLMARLDELEKEELSAEGVDESGDEDTVPTNLDMPSGRSSSSHNLILSKDHEQNLLKQSKDDHASTEEVQNIKNNLHVLEQLNDSMVQLDDLKLQSPHKGDNKPSLEVMNSKHDAKTSKVSEMVPPNQSSRSSHDSLKAFTGCIIERPVNLPMNPEQQPGTSSQPSKPVSRFKMQRK